MHKCTYTFVSSTVLDLLVVCVSRCNLSFTYFIYTYMSCVHALYALFHLLFHTVPGSSS